MFQVFCILGYVGGGGGGDVFDGFVGWYFGTSREY